MTDQLEQQLRDTFAREAERLPAAAGARLRHAEYHPRTRRVEPRIAIGAVGGTAIMAGAAAAIVSLGASATPAFAGWTSTPSELPRPALSLTIGTCGKQLPHLAPAALTTRKPPGGGAMVGGRAAAVVGSTRVGSAAAPPEGAPPSTRLAGHWSTALTDTRGPYTFAIYTNGRGASLTCFTGPHFTSMGASVGAHATKPAADGIELSGPGVTARDGDPYSLAEGRVGSDVRGVTLVLADGTKVKASVARGWFLAWWPGATQLTAAEVRSAQGTTTRPLHFPTPPHEVIRSERGAPTR
jgi:hypothetical protein